LTERERGESKRSKHGNARRRIYEPGDEEYTNLGTKNLTEKGVSERFLWLGTEVVIGFLAALLLGLSGVPGSDSATRGDVAGAKILEDCAAKKIPGC
jgi:hypothetical protein